MTLRELKVRLADLVGAILSVAPIGELKVKHVTHPVHSIKHSYSFSTYTYFAGGGWNCEGRPGIDCPDAEDSCKHCTFHVYHKPYKPSLRAFVRSHLTQGISLIARSTVCFVHGHLLEDCSTAGPDSGNMDHQCTRCNRYWSVPLY